jgi:multicomponent Na+:H+ antiporter subunit B
MLYGHLSPGGGFQGGVVIASGIVFLEMGTPADAFTRLTQTSTLARIESAAFLLLVLVSLSGIVTGTGFFSDPIAELKNVPAGFIIILNTIIGLKVGAGIGVMCIALLQRVDD